MTASRRQQVRCLVLQHHLQRPPYRFTVDGDPVPFEPRNHPMRSNRPPPPFHSLLPLPRSLTHRHTRSYLLYPELLSLYARAKVRISTFGSSHSPCTTQLHTHTHTHTHTFAYAYIAGTPTFQAHAYPSHLHERHYLTCIQQHQLSQQPTKRLCLLDLW
jgi:hypothetical protein